MKNRTFVGCLFGIALAGVCAAIVVVMKSGVELGNVIPVLNQQLRRYDYSWQNECDDRCAEYIGSTAMAELDGAGCQQLVVQLELAPMFGEVDAIAMKAIRDKMASLPDCGTKMKTYRWQNLCDELCARAIGAERMQWLDLASCDYIALEVGKLQRQGIPRTDPIANAIYDKAQFAKCKTWL